MIKLTLLGLMLSALSLSVFANEPPSVNFCLAKDKHWDSTKHKSLMSEYGVNCATLYYSLASKENNQAPYVWVDKKYISEGYKVILTLIFNKEIPKSVSQGVLREVIEGAYDTDLQALADAIVKSGKPVVIRPFHELDGSWHPWGIYAKGNSPELAVAAVDHVVTIFREAKQKGLVTIEINFNRRDGEGKVLGEADRYVPALSNVVDAFSISSYNRCGTAKNYRPQADSDQTLNDFNHSFADEFGPAYERLSTFTDKPINVAETSTSGVCGNRLKWFTEMFTDISQQFPKVQTVTFFFGEVAVGEVSNDVPIQWGFDSPEKRRVFNNVLTNQKLGAELLFEQSSFVNNWEVRYPWNVYGQLSDYYHETNNASRNEVTGEEFGKDELVFRGSFTQKALFYLGYDVEIGPAIWVGTVQSTNDNMWWNNQFSTGISIGIYQGLSSENIKWGGWSVEVFTEQRTYTASSPDRFTDGTDIRSGIRAGLNFGGDWSN